MASFTVERSVFTLIEAIVMALFAIIVSYVMRIHLVHFDGIGTTGFTWRVAGLVVSLLLLIGVYSFSDRPWLAVALATAGIGLNFGLGANGVLLSPQSVQTLWDIQILWYSLSGNLATSHPSYDFYVSVGWVSLVGVLLALFGSILSFGILEKTLKELRRSQSHKGTNRYRSRETVFGDAKWGSWRKMESVVGDPNGIVLGEDYDPRQRSYD